MRTMQVALAVVVTTALIVLTGCGQSNRASLTGKVTLDGKPLDTGTVGFLPVTQGPAGYGTIQAGGGYTAQTGTTKGLTPGDYLVTVQAMGPIPPSTPQNPEPLPVSLLPDKYSLKETSGLRCTVTPGGTTYNIELKSQ